MIQRVKRLLRYQWRQFWRLANDRKPLRLADLGPFCPTRRFSAWLWGASGCTQLWQQCVHRATHLLRSRITVRVFPRTKRGLDQFACQHQVIVGNSHHVGPALELFGSTQTRLSPQQRLFVEAIAMFLAKAQHLSQSNFHHIGVLVPNPDEPTDARITLCVGGMRTHHTDDRHVQPARSFHVQVVPPGDLDRSFRGYPDPATGPTACHG